MTLYFENKIKIPVLLTIIQEMEDQPVTTMRETTRNLLKLNRRFHRDEQSDTRRCMQDISITQENIEAIINTLKTKSSVSVSELRTLKNALMEDQNTIELVLNTHGTLRGLVRELTGKEVRKQCEAAGCLCNLGLGDSKAGMAVAKAAGPYLIAALDSLSVELAVTCAWGLGNLAGSGRAAALLAAQAAPARLAGLLGATSDEVKDAAVYALLHFGWQLRDELRAEHLAKILEALYKYDVSIATSQLLFILSCHAEFNNILSEVYLQKILLDLPITLQSHISSCDKNCSKDCKLLYQIRTLGNVNIDAKVNELFTNCFTKNVECFKMVLVKDDVISKSVLWLLGNLYNYSSNNVLFNELLL